jgi:hypothetical protein
MNNLHSIFNYIYSHVNLLWYLIGASLLCIIVILKSKNYKARSDFYESTKKEREEQERKKK